MGTILEVRGLKKHFPVTKGILLQKVTGWVQAVDGVSFSVNQGETFSLVGESGCGKTTTSRLVLMLEQATAGSVLFRGKDVLQMKPPQLREYRTAVQAVFQDPYGSLDPRMRVRDIVAEPLLANRIMSRSQVKDRVADVLTKVGLTGDAASRYPHQFSGGQRQRIAVARALAPKPALITLDEPVSALDVSIAAQVMNLLKDIQAEMGVSFLLIAHNLATVRYMSHWVAVMYLGRIVEWGRSDRLYSRPLHPYTQALLAAALPDSPDTVRQQAPLAGEVPSPLNPPSGCRFHPRCPVAEPVCSERDPAMLMNGDEHSVACHVCEAAAPR